MAGQRRHHQHARLGDSTSLRKRSRVPKGVDATASSVTATSRLPTRTLVDAVGRALVGEAGARISS